MKPRRRLDIAPKQAVDPEEFRHRNKIKNEDFAHLHLHTQYSILDGFGTADSYAKRAKELGFTHMAVTDHGNVDGVLDFQKACLENEIIPIIGCEGYIVPDILKKEKGEKRYHVTLLVKNAQGWKNLLQLLTQANLAGYYYRPRFDPGLFLDMCEGLVVMTACTSTLLFMDNCEELLLEVANRTDLVAEVMPLCMDDQHKTNLEALRAEVEFGATVVATNDCHYPLKGQNKLQEVLLAMQRKDKWKNPNRWKFDIDDLYLKSAEEMEESFYNQNCLKLKTFQNAIKNTKKIANLCNFKIEEMKPSLPTVYVPRYAGLDEGDQMISLVMDGLARKAEQHPWIKADIEKYEDRISEELSHIMPKFTRYFLIVWELINWCRKNDIMVGGRGSSAGSLVSYCLGITRLDPIKYNLVFSRFISPGRIDLPDIDMDFEDRRRDEVKHHLRETYGEWNVIEVSTFLRMHGRGALRDVGRVFDIPLYEVDKAAKCIVTRSGGDFRADFTIEDAFATFEDGIKFKEKYPEITEMAMAFEGQVKSCVSGEARVILENSKGGAKTVKIKNLLKRHDRGSIRAYGFREDILFFDKVVDVTFMGTKDVIEIESGKKSLRLTTDHEVLTDKGWVKAGNLAIGSKIALNGKFKKGQTPWNKGKRGLQTAWNKGLKKGDHYSIMESSVRMRENNPSHLPGAKERISKSSFKHGLFTYPIVEFLRLNPICEFCGTRPSEDRHHIDGNRKNNSPENISAVCKTCHVGGIHARKPNRINPEKTICFKPIKAIRPAGREKVYDITMESKNTNFICNGIVVHNCGRHAAGVCVSNHDLRLGDNANVVLRNGRRVCNWEKEDAEHMGLMKLDILGLNSLTILSETRKLVKERHGIDIDYELIDLEDDKIYEQFTAGNTTGIFQFGSPSMIKLCRDIHGENFDQVVAINALHRPGALRSGMTQVYRDRKFGKEKVVHKHKILEEITKDTYGLILYQEQIMKMMYELGGLPWKTADTIRKVVSKSKGVEQFMSFKGAFLEGCERLGTLNKDDADEIFDELKNYGCLTGDTKIYRASSNQHSKAGITIKEAYDLWNGKMKWHYSNRGLKVLSMHNDGFVRLNTIKKIINTGKKEVFFIRTESNKYIRASSDHRFLTFSGWRRVEKLSVGELIKVTNRKTPNKIYTTTGGGSGSHGEKTPRLKKGEGKTNDKKEQREKLMSFFNGECQVCGSTSHIEMHHVDGDHSNNSDENTALLCRKCHKKESSRELFKRYKIGHYTQYEKIAEIRPVGIRETFDIEMEDEPRNFIANGFISHNSYGFNLSHAAEYSLNAVWQMYLKVYYPVEFMCTLLSYGPASKKHELIREAKRLGINILLPDINLSEGSTWVIDGDNNLLAPIHEIKGIGEVASNEIIACRENAGAYKSLEDLESRVVKRKVNAKVRKLLIQANTFKTSKEKLELPESELEKLSRLFDFELSNDPLYRYRNAVKRIGEKIKILDLKESYALKDKFGFYFGRMESLRVGYRTAVDQTKESDSFGSLGGVYGNLKDDTDFKMLIFGNKIYQAKKETIEHCEGEAVLTLANNTSDLAALRTQEAWFGDEILKGDLAGLKLNFGEFNGAGAGQPFKDVTLDHCERCELRQECKAPVPATKGLMNIMIVGEAPGKHEDKDGVGFVGAAGKILFKLLNRNGLDRELFHITNICKCYPSKTRTPKKAHILECESLLVHEIETVKPFLILAFGNTGNLFFRGETSGITNINGTTEWNDKYNAWITYSVHPAMVAYNPENMPLLETGIGEFVDKIQTLM